MDVMIWKSYYLFLKDFFEKNIDELRNSRVFIYGAGTRGHILVLMLKSLGCEDVFFVDNSIEKQGTELEGKSVLSFDEANKFTGKHIFLCPIDNNAPILQQLADTGR